MVVKHIEAKEYEYTCGEPGCCYESWYELTVDGKLVQELNEYGTLQTKRFGEIPYNLDDILFAITGDKYTVEFTRDCED